MNIEQKIASQSDSVKALAKALCSAQSKMEAVHKDSRNPFFNSNYATLAQCWAAAREPLAQSGLSVTQTVYGDQNSIVLKTLLIHESGEWIRSDLPLILSKRDMQGLGSALTYARRYGLCAIIGLAQEDDDGNDLVQNQGFKPLPKKTVPTKQRIAVPGDYSPSSAQLKRLFAISRQNDWSDEEIKSILQNRFGVDSSKNMTLDQYNELCDVILPQGPSRPSTLEDDVPIFNDEENQTSFE